MPPSPTEICSCCSRPILPADTPYLSHGKVLCELCHAALTPAKTPAARRTAPPPAKLVNPRLVNAPPPYRLLQAIGITFHLLGFFALALGTLLLIAGIVHLLRTHNAPPPNPFAPAAAILADFPLWGPLALFYGLSLLLSALTSLAIGQALLRLRDLTRNAHRTATRLESP